MEILRTSPMLGILAALISASAMFDKLGIFSFIIIAPVIYCAVMFCSYENEIPNQWQIFLAGLIILSLCSLRMHYVFTKTQEPEITLTNSTATVRSIRQWGTRNYAAVIELDNGKKYVTRLHFAELMAGDRIKFDGQTQSFKTKNNDSDFDEARYWGARNIISWIKLYNIEELPRKFNLSLFRHKLSRKLTMYMPKAASSYLKAAWIGERDELLNRMHRKWGTIHILAVSGFHIGLVIYCAFLIFGNKTVILSIILWAYVLLSGAAPSALRAGLMLQAGLISKFFGRPVKTVNSVCTAGVIILMYSPLMFWDIGFRLSMLCALTIASFIRKKYMSLILSPLLSIVTFPQISYTFGKIMVVGIFLNLFTPIHFAFAFTIASFFGILRLLNFPFMKYIMLCVEGIFVIYEKIADFCANIIPYSIGWNYFIAWIGTGTLIFCLCRYFNLAPLRTLIIMISVTFMGFVMFL